MRKPRVVMVWNEMFTNASWVARQLPFFEGSSLCGRRMVALARSQDGRLKAHQTAKDKRIADWQRAATKGRTAAWDAAMTLEWREIRARSSARCAETRQEGAET